MLSSAGVRLWWSCLSIQSFSHLILQLFISSWAPALSWPTSHSFSYTCTCLFCLQTLTWRYATCLSAGREKHLTTVVLDLLLKVRCHTNFQRRRFVWACHWAFLVSITSSDTVDETSLWRASSGWSLISDRCCSPHVCVWARERQRQACSHTDKGYHSKNMFICRLVSSLAVPQNAAEIARVCTSESLVKKLTFAPQDVA